MTEEEKPAQAEDHVKALAKLWQPKPKKATPLSKKAEKTTE